MTAREQREALAEDLSEALDREWAPEVCALTGYSPRVCGCREHRERRSQELAAVLRGIAGL